MNDHDKALIESAEKINHKEGCIAWHRITKLAEQAYSDKAREQLENMSKRMYHKEEHLIGLL